MVLLAFKRETRNSFFLQINYLAMTPFAQIKFAQTQTHRCKTLSEIMPVGEDWSYFVVLSDAYLTTDDGEIHIRSFSDLQDAMNVGDGLQALKAARARGKLTEGRHELPDVVARILSQSGMEPPTARRWAYGASESITEPIALMDLASTLAKPEIEEIEVADQFATWYFRSRDDEPFIFLAVRGYPLTDRIRHCVEYCREARGDFEYTS
jgi:hypothetical protein